MIEYFHRDLKPNVMMVINNGVFLNKGGIVLWEKLLV